MIVRTATVGCVTGVSTNGSSPAVGIVGEAIEEWSIDYNANRPHTSVDGLSPDEFATGSMVQITGHAASRKWLQP